MAAEKNFENRVKKYLEEKGCWYIKYWGGAAYTKADLQLYNLQKIKEAGGLGCLLYPKHFELFRELIERVQACEKINIDDYPFLTEWNHIHNS